MVLPVKWNVNGREIQQDVVLSTDASVTTPEGVIRGRRLNVQNGASPIGLVGQTSAGAAGAELVEIESKPGAVDARKSTSRAIVPDSDEPKAGSAEASARVPFKDLGATTLHILVDGSVRALDR